MILKARVSRELVKPVPGRVKFFHMRQNIHNDCYWLYT